MPSRPSLKQFLSAARAALTAAPPRRNGPLTFVVGNESADLDSLCSALVCAYIRSNSPPHTLHVPLSNLPRADLSLRTEMTAVLRHAGLVPDDLITLSELPDDADAADWFLVDHNALTGPLRRFQPRVVGVVDHHVDEGVTGARVVPRIVEPCGSCVSLLVDEYRSAWEKLSFSETDKEADKEGAEGEGEGAIDASLAKLGLAPILIDTSNLTEEGKVKDKDVRAVDFLMAQICRAEPPFSQAAYFDEIVAVKEDISRLSFRDILRKDYKEWVEAGVTLGISCVAQNLDYLHDKAGGDVAVLVAHLADWAAERKLDVASIMTVSNPGGEFQRDLLVWGITEAGRRALHGFCGNVERLQLEPWRGGLLDDGNRRLAWRQWDLTSSRKQVAPLLREALKGAGSPSCVE